VEPADQKPACAACGATEGIHASHHAGWLCDDVIACFDRAGARQLTVFDETAQTRAKLGSAAAEDIPEKNKVFFVTPYHREEITDPETLAAFERLKAGSRPATFEDLDGIHGTGRCTCGGEGRCAWCQEICERCFGDGTVALDGAPCEACNGTGYADGLELTMEERAAKIEAIRADEADYAALGYPETEITESLTGYFDDAVLTVDVAIGTLFGDVSERLDRFRHKYHG